MNKSLKELRLERKMTQVETAIKLNVSLATYRLWEAGVTSPNEENQKILNDFLKKDGHK